MPESPEPGVQSIHLKEESVQLVSYQECPGQLLNHFVQLEATLRAFSVRDSSEQ